MDADASNTSEASDELLQTNSAEHANMSSHSLRSQLGEVDVFTSPKHLTLLYSVSIILKYTILTSMCRILYILLTMFFKHLFECSDPITGIEHKPDRSIMQGSMVVE